MRSAGTALAIKGMTQPLTLGVIRSFMGGRHRVSEVIYHDQIPSGKYSSRGGGIFPLRAKP